MLFYPNLGNDMTLPNWKSSGEVNNKLYVITRVKFLKMHEDFIIGTQWTQLKKKMVLTELKGFSF